jgi:hypothetical protein
MFRQVVAADVFETGEPENNSSSTPAAATIGSNILSQISSTTDKDWWSFANTSTNKNIKITLTTLPGDYDIKLYNPSGTNVKTSELGGTSSETIIYNNGPVGTYKIQVYGYNGAFSTTQCYTMLVYKLVRALSVLLRMKPMEITILIKWLFPFILTCSQ